MIELLLQFVVALMSTLTAAAAVAIWRFGREFVQTVEKNEQRSKANRTVLHREGLMRRSPVASGGNSND